MIGLFLHCLLIGQIKESDHLDFQYLFIIYLLKEVKRKIDKGEQLRIEADILKYRNNQLKADPNANTYILFTCAGIL